MNKYTKAVVTMKGGSIVEFDPHDADQVVEAMGKMILREITSVTATLSQDQMKKEWQQDVATGETELSFNEWLKRQSS